MNTFCLGTGEIKCDGCQQEKNWQMLNQMPDALRLSLQKSAYRIDCTECIINGRTYFAPTEDEKGGEHAES